MPYRPRQVPLTPESHFLFGPRGTGKSTWLKRVYPRAGYVDLLDPVRFRELSSRPERLREVIVRTPPGEPVIIDEIQKVPGLLDVVQQTLEGGRRRPQFILTGSSARKLRRTGVNLLGGRLLWREFHPYLAGELGDEFSVREAVEIGMLPLIRAARRPVEALRAYASLAIQQEVREESSVRDLGAFGRFLEAVALSHGGQLNLSAVASECAVTRRSVEGYVEVLEDMMLAFRLQVFSKRAKRLLAAHPKFYYFDAGVFRSLRPKNPLDSTAEVVGAAVEGLVAQHLRAWLAHAPGKNSLSYWRSRNGLEVDFVIFGESGFRALEVKSGATSRSGDLDGLKAFRRDYPEARVGLLAPSPRNAWREGIPVMDLAAFLRSLRPGAPFPDPPFSPAG